jgi:hypothetical protein
MFEMNIFQRHTGIIITEDYDALPDSLWRALCFLLRRSHTAEPGRQQPMRHRGD